MRQLEDELEHELASLEATFDPAAIELEEHAIRSTSSNVEITVLGLVWLPYRSRDLETGLEA